MMILPGCSAESDNIHLYMLPLDKMPAESQPVPVSVQEIYRPSLATRFSQIIK